MRRILVTGGAGYIGSHTAKAMAEEGYEPVVLDNLSSGNEWAVRWGPFIQGNIADQELVRRVIKQHRIDGVIHFAANAYVGESIVDPRKYFENNVTNALGFLHCVMDCGVRDVVFSSTCATYGNPRTLPIAEDHPQVPVNPYGDSKLFVEKALDWYSKAHSLRFVSLRYFNASGADPDGEIGECHDPETHLIPLAIRAAQTGFPALKVFGTDYDTPDGTAVRDYIHVSDLAQAHIAGLKYLARNGASTAVNLGTGRGHSVREIQRAVERIGGRRVPCIEQRRREGDPAILVAKADKARKLLGWEPRFTHIEEIIETAWRWHSRQAHPVAAAV